MRFKKRGVFVSKRAEETSEGLSTIGEMVFFAIFAFLISSFAYGVYRDTTFQKNYFARDIAMTIDVLYASPNDIIYIYPTTPLNLTGFSLAINQHNVRLADKGTNAREIIYWYADIKDKLIETPKLDNLTTVLFKKKEDGVVEAIPIKIREES